MPFCRPVYPGNISVIFLVSALHTRILGLTASAPFRVLSHCGPLMRGFWLTRISAVVLDIQSRIVVHVKPQFAPCSPLIMLGQVQSACH